MTEPAVEATFVFIDLAGFTALTETHGDERAADLAERFHAIADDELSDGDRFVKSIGDAVMLTAPEPGRGLRLVERVIGRCVAEDDFPVVRTGLHHGSAVRRGDDVFGAAVNLAARIAARAAGGQTLATEEVARAARQLGIAVAGLGDHQFRNVHEPVALYDIRFRPDEPEHVIDPVCRMRVTPASAAGWIRYADTDWWFCSLDCAGRFAEHPEGYLAGFAR